jgi:AraC-like DNA-binding protein
MLPQPITVSAAFVRGMLSGMQAQRIPCDAWLWQAGIPPGLLAQPGARVTAEQYVMLFQRMVTDRNDEGLGFFSRRLPIGSLALLLRGILGSPTLEAAMRRLCRGFEVLQQDVRMSVVRDGNLTGIRIDVPGAFYPQRLFLPEYLMRAVFRLLDWLKGERLTIVRFDFSYPFPSHSSEYGKLFPGEIRFEQPITAMWVDSAALRTPIYRDDASATRFLRAFYRYIVIPEHVDRLVKEQVRAHLLRASPPWPDLPQIADALQRSASTLQRQLADEGTSFRTIKDTLRRDLAIVQLVSTTAPMAKIAGELGFSDSAVFQRAFKGWTGTAPGTYRQKRLQPTVSLVHPAG